MKPFDRRRQVHKQAYKPQRKRIKLLKYLNHGEAKHKEESRTSRQTQHTNTRKQTKHKSHAPIRGIPRQIEIPRDFYHCIPPGLTSLEISLLEFDHDAGTFSIENSVETTQDEDPPSRTRINRVRELTFTDTCPQEDDALIRFVGNTNASKVKILLNGMPTQATIDTGCEGTVIASSLADTLISNWTTKLEKDTELFEGPSGEELTNLGRIPVTVQLGGKERDITLNVIKGTADSILLGNPALKSFGAIIEPGIGIHLKDERTKPKATNNVTQRQTATNQRRALALEAADTARQTLPPLALAVVATDTTIIPPFGREWISFIPHKYSPNTKDHSFQRFILRPCHCILKGEECTTCIESAQRSPYQLVVLENDMVKALFINTKATPWVVTPQQDHSIEFQSHTYSCKELATALLEEIEQEPLESPYTQEETRRLFDLSVEDFKSKLHNIICEPGGFQEGFREPTLKLHPEPPPSDYSKRTIPLADYLTCNPCKACSKADKTVCDARIVGCITKSLYEPDLPENYESRIIDHKQQCDISRAADDHTTLVICNRGGMTNLHTALAELHPGYTVSQKEYTDSSGKHTIMIQSCLPNLYKPNKIRLSDEETQTDLLHWCKTPRRPIVWH